MNRLLLNAAALGAVASIASAHDGRRFDIQVIDGQIFAQGYITEGSPDDGGGRVRPYRNAIHDHWINNEVPGIDAAMAWLPSFDLLEPGPLAGHDLTLTLTGASRWVDPPVGPDGMVPDDTLPALEPLDPDEEIFVGFDGESVSTGNPGSLTLGEDIPSGGLDELDVRYDITLEPTGVIYVVEFRLSTDAPGIDDSETVYALLAPQGSTRIEGLHYQSLFLEAYLGIPACGADLTGPAGNGLPDGDLTADDFFFYLGLFASGDAEADLTGPGGDGTPDGQVTADDFFFYLELFSAGCA